MTPEYLAISRHYGDRTAVRSGVRLMQHIDEGLVILERLWATDAARSAWCLHPIIQNAKPGSLGGISSCSPYAVFLATEYRHHANRFLRHHMASETLSRDIDIGEFDEVRMMLIADKVQNRCDFEKYHLGIHPDSDDLVRYFSLWFEKLQISEKLYLELIK
jgi:hypothetical protein